MTPVRLAKPNKYNAKAITIDGHRFASQAEGRRYGELKLLEKSGEIRNLVLQPWFVLMAPVMDFPFENINEGKWVRVTPIGRFTADFKYELSIGRNTWRLVVEDVKSKPTRTTAYMMRKRHFEAQYQLVLIEITR